MDRQSRPLTGWSCRKADHRSRRSAAANFGAPLPSLGIAKGSKPTIWTEARRDAPRGNAPAWLNGQMEKGMTMSKFVHLPLTVMPALVAGIHAFVCRKARRGWPEQVRP